MARHSRSTRTDRRYVKAILARLDKLTALTERDELDHEQIEWFSKLLMSGHHVHETREHIGIHVRLLADRSSAATNLLAPLLERFPLNPVTS